MIHTRLKNRYISCRGSVRQTLLRAAKTKDVCSEASYGGLAWDHVARMECNDHSEHVRRYTPKSPQIVNSSSLLPHTPSASVENEME